MPSQIDEAIAKMRGLSQKATEEMRFYSARLSGAEEILAIIQASQPVVATSDVITIRDARRKYQEAFQEDPGFRRGYVDNIVELLERCFGVTEFEVRERAANDIVKLIFEGR